MWIVLAFVYLYVSTSVLLFHGPFHSLRKFFIQSVATSRHGYLLTALSLDTVPKSEINAVHNKLNHGIPSAPVTTVRNFSQINDGSIKQYTVAGHTYTANVMIISNPNRVKVAITKYLGQQGETVLEMAQDAHAVAAINAGAFEDVQYRGTGGIPLGITMHGGKLLQNDKSQWASQPVIAITKNGQLICGNYPLAKLEDMGTQEAVSFGPVLIQNGQPASGVGGWGIAPRTAIGQTASGAIIFVVTDGRLIHGGNDLGATMQDLQQIMLKFGAVTAANLDGGSSATMVYNGKLVNQPTDVLGQRKVATSFIVLPNHG